MMKKEVLRASSLSREELLQKNPMEKKKKHSQILILNVKEILKDLQILHTSDNVHNLLVYEIPVIDFKNNSAGKTI